jgi:hypothetical protein
MAKRGSASRMAFTVLLTGAVIGGGVWLFKPGAPSGVAPLDNAMLPTDSGPSSPPLAAQIEQPKPDAKLTRSTDGPATSQPAVQTVLDVEQLFKRATELRDQGDLVTARNLVNDALASNKLDAADVDAAKSFIGDLQQKIIFGRTSFNADAFTASWKVESGQVADKFTRRFDITSELFGRINGIDAHKIKAGKTYKMIKGPFHLVVSKSRFTADVYLGAPGGAGSMYVKTYRVGLGSDDSTPLGTWKVSSGKLKNPVYYSPRGEGVIAGDDPKNPLGERWIPLEGVEGDAVGKQSYGIHGTIEPDSIGKNMSHGCIRLMNEDVEVLYDLVYENKTLVKVVP